MPRTYEGLLVAPEGARFAIVAGRFNDFITSRLLDGARDALVRHGADAARIDTAWCPGAYEIPLVAHRLAASGRYDAVVCLGAVIRGETAHFDHVAGGVSAGIQRAALDTGVPVLFGVLTVDSVEQAIDRAGAKAGNKGAEAALAALEMIGLLRAIDADATPHAEPPAPADGVHARQAA